MVGITCSDLHLWSEPPLFRAEEPDWWAAMQRPVDQIKELAVRYSCPIFFAGDLFNHFRATPELINWALKHVPFMYGVPGQHDLPYHRYDLVHKSPYWTLVEANRIVNLEPGVPHPVNDDIIAHGFPWGCEVRPCSEGQLTGHNLAIVHAYCWHKTCFPGAPKEKEAAAWGRKLDGYQWAVFGDHHEGFDINWSDDTWLLNTGTMMIRKADERGYSPRVYLLWSDGGVTMRKLDTSADVYTDEEAIVSRAVREVLDSAEVVESFGRLRASRIDFMDALKDVMERLGVAAEVREMVLSTCEERK